LRNIPGFTKDVMKKLQQDEQPTNLYDLFVNKDNLRTYLSEVDIKLKDEDLKGAYKALKQVPDVSFKFHIQPLTAEGNVKSNSMLVER
jgi:hypothetical protein